MRNLKGNEKIEKKEKKTYTCELPPEFKKKGKDQQINELYVKFRNCIVKKKIFLGIS